MRIILVGYMGSGKTTFGKTLAKRLNLPFLDSDKEIAKKENKSINSIFEQLGETEFRKMESAFINSLKDADEAFVLATGGGLPCFNNNMDLLNALGTTIYLEMSPKALLKRLENGIDQRPILKQLNEDQLLNHIETQLDARSTFYKQAYIIFPGIEAKNPSEIDKLITKIHSK